MGFEYFYGFVGGDTSQWHPGNLYRNTMPIFPFDGQPGWNLISAMADEAIGWIRMQHEVSPKRPWVIHYAPGATHAPHHPTPEWIERIERMNLFDDGWDDHQTLWHFNAGFPHGFTPLHDAAARYGAGIGVWLSPWGGYGKPRQGRLAAGKAQGLEENEGGFALSGPTYYARFRDTCLDMIRTYGVNQFKFDGTGNVAHAIPGSAFDSDFDAMIALIEGLRAEEPDLFVNLTTGTYPSPFFLRYADSIWRGGDEHAFAGVGTKRQQWST